VGVPGTVLLESGAVAVVAIAVGLDDQAAVAPEEVDLVRADECVYFWLGKAVATAEGKEEPLELTAGELVLDLEVVRRDQAQVERAPDGAAIDRLRKAAVKIAERSGGLRQRDAVAAGHKIGNEGVGSVNPDPSAFLPAAVTRDGDLDWPRVWVEHAPHGGSAAVAHGRSIAESKNRSHALSLERQAVMANGVHPTVKTT
jgi:hypothetical protein